MHVCNLFLKETNLYFYETMGVHVKYERLKEASELRYRQR